MKAQYLAGKERRAFNRWLFKSHDIRLTKGMSVVRFEMEYFLFAVKRQSLPKLRIWKDRDHEDYMLSFDVSPGRMTICRLFGYFPNFAQAKSFKLKQMESELQEAALLGQIWWGTESLKDEPELTTILQYFPEPHGRP